MPPKKAAAAPKKAAGAAPTHASYQDMIKEAIMNLKEKGGSSRQAIKKYVLANNNLGGVSDAMLSSHFNKALTRGSETGVFERPKVQGPSGPVKLSSSVKKEAAKAASPPTAKKTEGKAAPKKAAAKPKTEGKVAPKKAAAKPKTAATKAAPKAAAATKKAAPAKATKAKANSSKPRKSATDAPAVEDKKPVVLGKTKSGRVTKTTASAPRKAAGTKKAPAAKKAAPKKASPKKAAA
ncbi:hypothetical protein AAFC00_006746 [Neodothiora populina]|uniref:Histone H1 n=1 Tax=Neodothiora populina TaxID=2781224 RepID=A0ABR3PB03_9PEZI